MVFVVKGKILLKDGERSFSKKVEAKSERMAREITFCLFGSHHRVRRDKIIISSVEKVE
jgi:ribosomal protein L20A (L18A)